MFDEIQRCCLVVKITSEGLRKIRAVRDLLEERSAWGTATRVCGRSVRATPLSAKGVSHVHIPLQRDKACSSMQSAISARCFSKAIYR